MLTAAWHRCAHPARRARLYGVADDGDSQLLGSVRRGRRTLWAASPLRSAHKHTPVHPHARTHTPPYTHARANHRPTKSAAVSPPPEGIPTKEMRDIVQAVEQQQTVIRNFEHYSTAEHDTAYHPEVTEAEVML